MLTLWASENKNEMFHNSKFFIFVIFIGSVSALGVNGPKSTLFYDQLSDSLVGFWCNLEDHWCDGWLNGPLSKSSKDNETEFILFSGPTATPETGPLYDHTFKNETGHYLLLEGSLGNPGSAAVLRSPNINFGAYTAKVSPDLNFPVVIYR